MKSFKMAKNDKVEEAKKEEGSQFNVQVDCKAIRFIYLQKTSTFQFRLSQCLLVLPLCHQMLLVRELSQKFVLQVSILLSRESAFSLHIMIRKRFIKATTLKVSQPQAQKEEEHSNIDLLARIQDLDSHQEKLEYWVKVKKYLENSDKNHVKFLEDNLMKAEADMFKHSEQFGHR